MDYDRLNEQVDEIFKTSLLLLDKRALVDMIILLIEERDNLKEELENE